MEEAGHRERLRKRFLDNGFSGFHDYEIIELLLTINTPRKDCKPVAKEMMKKFKTLQNLLESSPEELKQVKGLGDKNIFPLLLIKSTAELYLKKKIIKREALTDSKDVFDYLFYSMSEKDVELFKVIFLDGKNRVLEVEDIHRGSISSSPVYPREVVKSAIRNKASSLIFAHNHPSGSPEPSKSDILITRRLVHALLFMDIKVHEHIIIGENSYYSFADSGLIRKFFKEFEKMEMETINGK